MPTFRNELPALEKNQGWGLRRTPESGQIIAVATSPNIIVCDTHFWKGRTTPCERITNEEGKTIDDTPCPACVAKQGYRTHCYIAAYDAKRGDHFIFECTGMAAKPFAEYIQATGTLRGCAFCARRPKGTKNSKVEIVCNTANLTKIHLPNPPDIISCLAVIWRLPGSALRIETERWGNPTIKTDPKIIREERTQEDNSGWTITEQEFEEKKKEIDRSFQKANGKAKKEKAPV